MKTEILIKALLVEDDETITLVVSDLLKDMSVEVCTSTTLSRARQLLCKDEFDLVLLDLGLPDGDGLEFINEIKVLKPSVDIIVLTGRNEASPAVLSMKRGVFDYIVKPFDLNDLRHCINRVLLKILSERIQSIETCYMPVGESKQTLNLKEQIQRIADYPVPVLITGETGTGKELVARAIHSCSSIFRGPFVKVDCGVLSPTIIESELFGYEKGAFTDAKTSKKGLVELASRGVLFFDEISNLPYNLQAKLLQLIEEKRFRRLGGVKEIEVNLRIIAATNEDLAGLVRSGRFREDLYWRLNVLSIELPPLRNRPDDILPLAYYFLEKSTRAIKKNIQGFSPVAEKMLLQHHWPGNVRELRNAVERAVIYCRAQWIEPEDLGFGSTASLLTQTEKTEIVPLSELERQYIKKVLEATGWNKSKAARMLGISRTTLREKIRSLNI